MTDLYADATTFIALGSVDELELLTAIDGSIVVVPAILSEVTSQPARAHLERLVSEGVIDTPDPVDEWALERAMELLGANTDTADVRLLAHLLASRSAGRSVAIISDDRRLRTVSRGLGIPVTGTIGVVVRAVADGLDPDSAKALVRRMDDRGLHMTGELRDAAFDLIDDAD